MIDWVQLGINALWIVGAAVVLATVSLASYRAQSSGRRLGEIFADPQIERYLNAGFFLVALGLLLSADTNLRKIIWTLFAVWFGFLIVASFRSPSQA